MDDEHKESKLAKDSVSSGPQSSDDIRVRADKFILGTLKTMWKIMIVSAEKQDFEKGRKCIEAILKNAKFVDER